MFTSTITDSDLFIEMPISAQALYFHLGLHADDEGFLDTPKRILRAIGCNIDDLKLLIEKGFVICFDSGIIVITHWNLHNSIRKDRKKQTFFQSEKALLSLKNGVYSQLDNQMSTKCQPSVNQMTAQDKLSKDKLSKDKLISIQSTSVDGVNGINYQNVLNSFNSICVSLPKVKKLTAERKRKIKNLKKNLDNLTFDDYFTMIEQSDFLTGRNGVWNNCNFDWCMKPTNCIKIIEGNYKNKEKAVQSNLPNYEEGF